MNVFSIKYQLIYFIFKTFMTSVYEKSYSGSMAYQAEAVFPIAYFKAEAVIGRRFPKIVILQYTFFALVKAWRNVWDRFHFGSFFISYSCLLFY